MLSKNKKRKDIKAEEEIKDIKIVKNIIVDSSDYKIGNFTYYDNDPQSDCKVEEAENIEESNLDNKG